MAMTRAQWETTNRARELVLGVLRDSPHDAMTAGEVYAAIVDAELTSSMQTAVVLKFAAADGLVIRETGHTAREVLWRISEAGKSWKPEPYNWKKSRGDKLKVKPQAQAPAISAQGDLRPQNGHKPAPTHPYNVTPAVAKAPRPAPVTRPLPAHLESKPDLPNNDKPLLGPCDSYQEESARRRAEYWKAEQIAANRKIDAMMPVIAAARCIRHWHDSVDGGMVVSGEHVRALWEALADYDELEGSDGR